MILFVNLVNHLHFKSNQFKDGLRYITVDILGEEKESEVKKAFRILEKEV